MNKRWGFLLLLVLLTLGGCHKKQSTAEAVQSSAPAREEAGQTSSEQEDVHITATHNKTGYRLLASSLDWTPEIPLYLQELNGGLCFYDAGAGLLCTADSAGHKLYWFATQVSVCRESRSWPVLKRGVLPRPIIQRSAGRSRWARSHWGNSRRITQRP